MTELLDAAITIVIPLGGLCAVLGVAGGAGYLWDVYAGLEPAPRWMTRRYWHRKLCRAVCRLADLEAVWEQRKNPRKGGASRGIVGQQIHRAEYGYIKIVPQPDPRVKGLQIEKTYRR